MRLNPLDAVWLMMESADTPMHVGVLAVFKKPARAPADYLATMAAQMRQSREPAAPWHYRLAQVGSSALAPRLVEDAHFDLDYHFRHSALPAPGGERELGVVVSRLHSMELDRNRPLWEFHLIEGLERNRFACYLKVHHALVDNVTGIPLFTSLLSSRARDRQLPPPWCVPLDLSGAAADSDFDSGELWRALAQPADTLASLRQASSGFLRNIARRGSDGSVLLPRGTPRSTLNRRINAQRRFATQQFELARIESLAAASDTTVNTILAYLCGSSLRRFFKEYNALPEASLIGALPVSLQERSAQVAGNAIADLRVALGTHIGDPLARLEAVKAALDEVRRDRASLPASAVSGVIALAGRFEGVRSVRLASSESEGSSSTVAIGAVCNLAGSWHSSQAAITWIPSGEGNGSDGLRVAVGEGVGGDENADPSNSIVRSANASMIGVCTLT